ncbi:gamma-glutamyltransferase, partial [Alphaproteobacteria bacterium]|nr:gamma-glutamyltransferase [Alphaproteobacteria bacterium]
HASVGVPGSVAGMVSIHQRFGSLPWEVLLSPAIELAQNGFVLTEKGADMFNRYADAFAINSRDSSTVIKTGGWQAGDIAVFEDLAKTLTRIKDEGLEGFYQGDTARLLIEEMESGGGIIKQKDLDDYRAIWRQPLAFQYRGYDVISMPPPSSGGVALAQLLGSVEPYNLSDLGHNSAAYMHLLIEAERRAYADRAVHLGDPDFVRVPVQQLMDPAYIAARMSDFDENHKTNSADIATGFAPAIESVETTHFSVADAAGNAVAITTTLNGNFGSKVIVKGAGFFLNNEMDDFSIKQGHANQFGLLGGHANSIAPGKRMLSSMTPTIVSKDDDLFAVIGTPGGATIITSVFQSILNMIDFGMTAQEAVNARKFHSQWQPDIVLFEKGTLDLRDLSGLYQRGHKIVTWPNFTYELGRLEIIRRLDDGRYEGASDWMRGLDDRAVGF